jgi:type I restriction enzyme M protein
MGREIYRTNESGEFVHDQGQLCLDHDLDDISQAWVEFRSGAQISYEGAWTVPLSRLVSSPEMPFNPLRYAPRAERALAAVLELAGSEEWTVERLGDFATVFNGPRFKRPFAEEGATLGGHIVSMFTPKAFFEERGESAKLLDLGRASATQLRQIEVLTLRRDYILIVDSGTAGKLLGRVGMTTALHEGAVGNNNLIRVVIHDPARRAYVYQFLRSPLGKELLLRNVYGTNQDHIEPDHVKDIPIPIPRDGRRLEQIQRRVRHITRLKERASDLDRQASQELGDLFGGLIGEAGVLGPEATEGQT